MSNTVIQARELGFSYNSREVLRKVGFSLERGDYLGLVGPNGSGKSTLLKIILRILAPSRGEVTLFGEPLRDFRQWARIGYLPQRNDSFNPSFPATAGEVVALGLQPSAGRGKKAVDESLALVGAGDLRDKLIGELSGGERQRVLIARALVGTPEILILDEPSSALDPEARESFFGLLRELNESRPVTIVLVTHDLGNIGRYAGKLLYLDREVLFFGSFADFCRSEAMTSLFGAASQHIICHRHGPEVEG